MLTPDIAVAPQAQYGNLAKTFNDLSIDIATHDGRLETAAGKVPKAEWSQWFATTSQQVQDARDAFIGARPGSLDVIGRLGFEVRDLAAAGGRVGLMSGSNIAFGDTWAARLDSTVDAVRDAADALSELPPHGGPGGETPPTAPTTPGRPQLPTTRLVADVNRAVDLIRDSMNTIRTVPIDDRGDESTKQARLAAYHVNRAAQDLLEQHFATETPEVVTVLRAADTSLTDAAWQLAKKPSPDGRFTGVDIPGALQSSADAITALRQLGAPKPPTSGGDDVPTEGAGHGSTSTGDELLMGREPSRASTANHDDIPVGDIDYCTTPGFPRF